jgi:hypothetical protein
MPDHSHGNVHTLILIPLTLSLSVTLVDHSIMSEDFFVAAFLPPEAQALLLPAHLPYTQVRLHPEAPENTPVCPLASVFSTAAPVPLDEALRELRNAPIPPIHFLTALKTRLHDQWDAGTRSLVGLVGSEPMPLWTLAFFQEARSANILRSSWLTAHTWFEQSVKNASAAILEEFADTIIKVRKMFTHLGWNVDLGRNLHSSHLLELFGTGMISQRIVDAVATMLNDSVPEEHAVICTTDLQYGLELDEQEWDNYETSIPLTYIREIGERIKNGAVTKLTWPINLEAVHWGTIGVDTKERLIAYGDSLRWPRPARLVSQIRRWMSILEVDALPFDLEDLPTARQDDGYSCGVVSWNATERRHYHVPKWTPDRKHLIRVQYALRLSAEAMANVSPQSVSQCTQGNRMLTCVFQRYLG